MVPAPTEPFARATDLLPTRARRFVNEQTELKMARTIAAFFMLYAVALVSGMLTSALWPFGPNDAVRSITAS